MKKILIPIFIVFLLVFTVYALKADGESCLNHDVCESGVCRGRMCIAADIVGAISGDAGADPTGPCAEEGERIDDTDADGIDEYCDDTLESFNLLSEEDSCDHDYECESSLCSVDNECLSYEAMKEAVCRFVSPQSDWSDNQDDLYGSFDCWGN